MALLCLVADGAASPAPQGQGGSPARPNIVWISNEDMSPHLGAYGDALARTPVLDRLARESIRYTHAFTTAMTLRAKAIRYGYKESTETRIAVSRE